MHKIKAYKNLFFCLFVIFCFNFSFYIFLTKYNHLIPFNKYSYENLAYHLFKDPRIEGGQFGLLRALGQFDAQWYLHIAKDGYQDHMSLAFFPLYSILVKFISIFTKNLEFSGFIISNFLIFTNSISLYFVVKKIYNERLAFRTVVLFFLFPFGIFFRSYYTEGIQLFFLIWFAYFLYKRNWLFSSIFMAFLLVTKNTNLSLTFLFLYFLYKSYRKAALKTRQLLYCFLITLVPLVVWMVFNFYKTGNPVFFYTIQQAWYPYPLIPRPPVYNLMLLLKHPFLPLHSIHYSQIDNIVVLTFAVLIIKSKRFLKKELWLLSFTIWLFPILFRDLAAFSRLQSVSFPLFIFLASRLSKKTFILTTLLFAFGLCLTGLFFVNWYWIG